MFKYQGGTKLTAWPKVSQLTVLHFLPLTCNGEVMKLTWHEVSDIKIRDIQIVYRYLCPYCTLRVSKSLVLWCVFDRLSNFEKCNLRSGHLMWPGGVTFGVIWSSFFGNVPNCRLNSYGKFGSATRRRFFVICEKKTGGGRITVSEPPLTLPLSAWAG